MEIEEQRFRWIPIDEQLPEGNNIDVAVVTKHGPFARIYAFHDGKFYGWGKEDTQVTHWMMLPELPEQIG